MPKTDKLGVLEPVPLKERWNDEAKDFTPWVSTDGLELLSRALKVQLDLVGIEQPVGDFKVDIVCKDPDDETVVIENQLTLSDHKHAGQAITYGGVLNAATVVWVASRFRPEHRAAIGRLNSKRDPNVRYFGVEIKLWRIGPSDPAPQFVVVVHPTDWESGPTPEPEPGPNDTYYVDYWTSLREHLERTGSTVSLNNPNPKPLIFAPFGKAGFALKSSISVTKNQTKVDLVINGVAAEPFGQLLHSQKAEIEEDLGDAVTLDWKIPPDWSTTTISTTRPDWNLEDRNRWPDQFEWFAKHLSEFQRVFGARVRAIDPADYTPDESDDDQDDSAEARTDDDV